MMAMALSNSRVTLLVSIRTFLPVHPLSILTIPTIIPRILPSFVSEIFESVLRAVPKKKQSHSRRRMRQLAGKALQDTTALNKCPACGGIKRQNVLCECCVEAIKDIWRKDQGAGGVAGL